MSELLNSDHFLSEKELSQKTGVSIRTWQGYRFRGVGPKFIRFSGRCIRYQWRDVLEWVEQNKKQSTSEK